MAELGYKTESLQSRFELQKLLAAAEGRPEQHAVHFAVLRSLQRAIYSPKEDGHYALASDCYCHFTSPIRRYPDLTVHRLIDAILTDNRKPRNDYDELVVLARHCSDREQRAEAAERDLTKLKLLAYLSTRIGEEMDAVVTGVESYGIFVQGVKLPAEGLVRVETLSDDHYCFDRATHTLAGHRAGNSYRLGDLLRVAVARVDLERREVDFRVVQREKSKTAVPTKHTKSAKGGRAVEKTSCRQKNREPAALQFRWLPTSLAVSNRVDSPPPLLYPLAEPSPAAKMASFLPRAKPAAEKSHSHGRRPQWMHRSCKTPLYDWHVAHGGRMVDFAGWAMPVQYTSIIEEHLAIRSAVGIADISHMGRLRFEGPGAAVFLAELLTRRVADMELGQIRYSLVTNDDGGILDDVLVGYYHNSYGQPFFLVVVNAGNRAKIVDWVHAHLPAGAGRAARPGDCLGTT